MLPAEFNLTTYRGDTFLHQLKLVDADLRGSTVLAQVRERYSDAAIVLTLDTTLSYLSPDTFIEIGKSAAALQSVDPGEYVWDIQVTTVQGVVNTLLKGKFTHLPDVSRP